MKFLALLTVLLFPLTAKAQSGTIAWPTACPSNGCPGSYTDPNNVQVTVTSSYGTGTGSSVNMTQLQGTTAGATGLNTSSSASFATEGLAVFMNYGTNYSDAITGNLIKIALSKTVTGASFILYDLTSYSLSCNPTSSSLAVYNDMVVVTGLDKNGNTVNATLTEFARGSNNNGSYDPTDAPYYIVNEQLSISGNQAYVTGGYINTTGVANGATNATGNNAVSLDVSISFSVPVKEIRVLYRNTNSGHFSIYKYTNFCPAGMTTANFATGDLAPQAVLISNINYTGIITDIAGKVANDMTGNPDGVNGLPVSGATVNLYDAAGTTLIATTTTDALGNYTFDVPANTTYTVSVTLPSGLRHVSSTDATPADGKTSVAVGAVAVSGVNFGVNEPPVAANDTLTNQPPGSPATVPNLPGNDTDPSGGTLSADSISLVAPAGATIVTVDMQGDTTGFTIPGEGAWLLNANGSITFTPQAGFTGDPTPITYKVTDAAGLTSVPASVVIDYNAAATLSGTVYNDNNAGTPDGTPASGVIVTLYAPDGITVIATSTTDASGGYSFPGRVPGNYVVGIAAPPGYENVSSTDTTPANGLTSVTIGTANVTGVNFGVNEPPVAQTTTAGSTTPPAGNVSVPVAASGFGGTDPNSGTIDSLRITGFPSNTTSITIGSITYYPNAGSIPSGCATCVVFPVDGIIVPANSGGQPTVTISLDPSGTGATTVVIPYTVIDKAHLQDPTPGSLTLPFDVPLPVIWRYFTATPSGNDVVLNWATAMEKGTAYFEAEYATENNHFARLGRVAAAGNSAVTSGYSLRHSNAAALGAPAIRYRIRQADEDGHSTYSEIQYVFLNAGTSAVTIYPNPLPAGGNLIVTADPVREIVILDAAGRNVFSRQYEGQRRVTIPGNTLSTGTYLIKVNGSYTTQLIIR